MPDQEAYVEAVLSLVERIPEGRVTTYGLVAEAVGRGGAPVPWWRVVRADGSLPESHQREAIGHYREEGTPMRGSLRDAATLKVDLARCLWDPGQPT